MRFGFFHKYPKDRPRDVTLPTMLSATVDITGSFLTVVLSEPVNPAGAPTGFSITVGGVARGITYDSKTNSSTYVFSIASVVDSGATVLISYTPGDVADLAGNALAAFANAAVTNNSTAVSFPAGPVAHWKFNESIGDAAEYVNGYTGVAVNAPTAGAGKIDGCRVFTYGSNQRFTVADNADLSLGVGVEITIATWVWHNALAGFPCWVHKGGSAPNTIEYNLYYDSTAGRVHFEVGNGSTNLGGNSSGAITANAWHLVIVDAKPVGGGNLEIGVTVDGGARNITTVALGNGFDGGGVFELGAASPSNLWLDGKLDSVTIWKRVLTADERTAMWNGGAGRDYTGTLSINDSSLIEWWQLDEAVASGTRAGRKNSYTLSDNNTVGYAVGKSGNAAQFVQANQEFLYRATGADETPFRMAAGDSFTIAAFIYLDTVHDGTIVSKYGAGGGWGNGYEYLFDMPAGKPRLYLTTNHIDAAGALSTGAWHHVVVRYDHTNLKMRIDGVNEPNVACVEALTSGTAAFMIGDRGDYLPNGFNGRIDGVAISRRAWTDAECDLHRATNGVFPG